MANQQLLEYVKQQFQLGVARDAVKTTLLGSGWSEPDVNDALAAAGGAAPAAASAPAVTSDIKAASPAVMKSEPAAAMPAKKAEPAAFQAKMNAMSSSPAAQPAAAGAKGGSWMSVLLPVAAGVIILALLGAAAYLYMQNSELNENLTQNSQSNGELSKQVAGLTQEKATLLSQITALTETSNDLAMHVNFVLVPSNPAPDPLYVTIKGMLKGDDKTAYTLTSVRGLTVTIKNYKEPQVNALLKPLLGQDVLLTGSHVQGSRELTVTAVNGGVIAEPAPATPPAPTPPAPTPPAPAPDAPAQ